MRDILTNQKLTSLVVLALISSVLISRCIGKKSETDKLATKINIKLT